MHIMLYNKSATRFRGYTKLGHAGNPNREAQGIYLEDPSQDANAEQIGTFRVFFFCTFCPTARKRHPRGGWEGGFVNAFWILLKRASKSVRCMRLSDRHVNLPVNTNKKCTSHHRVF